LQQLLFGPNPSVSRIYDNPPSVGKNKTLRAAVSKPSWMDLGWWVVSSLSLSLSLSLCLSTNLVMSLLQKGFLLGARENGHRKW
jgi:hypothetical protein